MQKFLPLVIGVLLSFQSIAQMDSKITSGVVYFDQGDYQKAKQTLGLAMAEPEKLKEKNRAKGWYYLGRSAMKGYYSDVQNKVDPAPDPRVIVQATDALLQGLKLKDDKYVEKIRVELQQAQRDLIQLGFQYMNADLPRDAMVFLEPATKLNDGIVSTPNHVAHDLLGQCLLMEKDSLAALAQFKLGLDLLEKQPPAQADVLCGYMAYRAALIKRYGHYDNEEALALIRRGKDLTGREWIRIGNGEAKYAGDLKEAEDQHRNTLADLKRFELDILINSGEFIEEAVEKLKWAVNESPEEYILQVAYASLLEKVNVKQSIIEYEKAIALDASEQMAHFNLAAIYVNQAVELSDKANSTDDLSEAESLSREVKALFELALPHMRKALAAKPDDLGALNALIQITVFLGLTDEYNTYAQQRKLLTGQ